MSQELLDRIQELETENEDLNEAVQDYRSNLRSLLEDIRMASEGLEHDLGRVTRAMENLL